MKKFIVLQIPNSKNNGSAMMAINSISHFNNYFDGNIEFYCDFATDYDHKRIKSELADGIKTYALNLPKFNRGTNVLTSLLNRFPWIKEFEKTLQSHKPDAVIVLGGDDFSEYYSGYKIIIRLYLMYRLSLKFPLFLVGHTIGPFHSWRKKAFSFLMARTRIITRDELSLLHCKNDLNIKHVEQGHDLAWFDLPKQSDELKTKMLHKYKIEENKYITITPSALVSHYASNGEDYFNSWKNLVEKLQKSEYKIVFMPHVFNDNKKDDIWAIKEIEKKVQDKTNITFIDEMLLPSECRALLSGGYLSISCRMHSAVSTLQTGKPTIALSYSAKYAGVIGGDVGMPELIIEATNDMLWQNGIVEEIVNKIDYVQNNYQELKLRISKRIEEIKQDEKNILDKYAKLIDDNNGRAFDE